jgi:hypothetical protein
VTAATDEPTDREERSDEPAAASPPQAAARAPTEAGDRG